MQPLPRQLNSTLFALYTSKQQEGVLLWYQMFIIISQPHVHFLMSQTPIISTTVHKQKKVLDQWNRTEKKNWTLQEIMM